MFRKVLIANRGEIALRIIRACKELGVPSVAVYSTVDADAPAVRLADESIHIGPPAAKLSYLYVPNLIQSALNHGVDAIHPGYGFLSEDPYFAEVCAENGITFIGPRVQTMASVGDKARVREVMRQAGLPVLAGERDRVPAGHQGGRRWWRSRYHRGPRSGRAAPGLRGHPGGGPPTVRQRRRLRGAFRRPGTPHRGSDRA